MESLTDSVPGTTVSLPRFGEFIYSETDVIEFPWGLPGFPALHRWLLLTLDSQPSFVWLQSLDDVNVSLPTANPWLIFEDYDPTLPTYTIFALDIRNAAEFCILCTVVCTRDAKELTMNLAAPIVVNLRTNKARQVQLERSDYGVCEPIPRKEAAFPAELVAKAS